MIYTILLVVLILASAAVLGWLLWRKWPHLRIVDPNSSKEAKSRQLKYDLMRQRVERASGKRIDSIQKGVFQPIGKGLQSAVRRVAGKLTAVERSYQERQKQDASANVDSATLSQWLAEGRKLMDQEAWDRAEKKFIEVISQDPKHAEAYERLGRLYILKKDYGLAAQTFQFLAKLSPDDPSVIAALGEVEGKLGNKQKAFKRFKKAHKLSPNNPKYLDLLIESSIEVKEKSVALDALKQLKKVNPQNSKIESFSTQISEITMVGPEAKKPVEKKKVKKAK